jgi:hypothetical protein
VYWLATFLARNPVQAGTILVAFLFLSAAVSYDIYYGRYGLSLRDLNLSYVDVTMSLVSPYMLVASVLLVIDLLGGRYLYKRLEDARDEGRSVVGATATWNRLAWIFPGIAVVFLTSVLVSALVSDRGPRNPAFFDPLRVRTSIVSLTPVSPEQSTQANRLLRAINGCPPLLLTQAEATTIVYCEDVGLVRFDSSTIVVSDQS